MEDRRSGKYIEGKIKKSLEGPRQLLHPLELHCNEMTSDNAVPRTEEIPSYDGIQSKPDELNVNASEFQPKKTPATIGSIKMSDMVANEADDE